MSDAVIQARGLSYRAAGRALLENVDIDLRQGAVTVLVGPNGAGKSSLLRLLSGEARLHSGSVLVDGTPLSRWPTWRLAAKRAVLPQSSAIPFAFTVAELAALGVEGIGRGLDRVAKQRIVAQAMAEADVEHLALRPIDRLSGGERQRAQLARVLAQLAAGSTLEDRQILLLDEPTAGLDIGHQIALMALAVRLARSGRAVLAILHELTLALRFADHLITLVGGRIAAAGPVTAHTPTQLAHAFGVSREDVQPSGGWI